MVELSIVAQREDCNDRTTARMSRTYEVTAARVLSSLGSEVGFMGLVILAIWVKATSSSLYVLGP